jgi:hypothetical protein
MWPPLLPVMRFYVKEYAVAVISAALIYGGMYQIISAIRVLIYPIAHPVPLFVAAAIHAEFHYVPPVSSYYSEARMWVLLIGSVAIAVIVIAVGILFGLDREVGA